MSACVPIFASCAGFLFVCLSLSLSDPASVSVFASFGLNVDVCANIHYVEWCLIVCTHGCPCQCVNLQECQSVCLRLRVPVSVLVTSVLSICSGWSRVFRRDSICLKNTFAVLAVCVCMCVCVCVCFSLSVRRWVLCLSSLSLAVCTLHVPSLRMRVCLCVCVRVCAALSLPTSFSLSLSLSLCLSPSSSSHIKSAAYSDTYY